MKIPPRPHLLKLILTLGLLFGECAFAQDPDSAGKAAKAMPVPEFSAAALLGLAGVVMLVIRRDR